MAQLRDAHTSEFIAEGTPLQMATLAKQLGNREVVFDDVGVNFDPQAVLDAHDQHVSNAEDPKAVQQDAKLPRGTKPAAERALADARARIKE